MILTGVSDIPIQFQAWYDRALLTNLQNVLLYDKFGANRLMNSEETQNLIGEVNTTLAAMRTTLGTADSTLVQVRADAAPLLESLASTLESAQSALDMAARTLSEESDLNYQIVSTLRELESTARSLRELAEYLERDPQGLLRGRVQE